MLLTIPAPGRVDPRLFRVGPPPRLPMAKAGPPAPIRARLAPTSDFIRSSASPVRSGIRATPTGRR